MKAHVRVYCESVWHFESKNKRMRKICVFEYGISHLQSRYCCSNLIAGFYVFVNMLKGF